MILGTRYGYDNSMFRRDSLVSPHTPIQLFQLTVLLASAIASAPGKKNLLNLYKSIVFLQSLDKAWDFREDQGTG